jgi:O-antigen ligase
MRAVTRPAPAAAVPLVLVPALGLSQGGFSPDAWVWAGALAAWAAAIGVVLSDDAGALRRAWSWLAAVGALLAWTILSAAWSAHAAQSVLDARRTLCYAAVVLVLVVLARPGGDRAVVLATHLALTFVVVYALTRYLLGPHDAQEFEGYLLADPLGYANAVGIVAVLGTLLALGVGSRSGTAAGRAAAAATVPPFLLALQLSGSHASWLALAAGGAVALLLEDAPRRLARVAGAVAAPAVVLVLLGRWSGLAALPTPRIAGWVVALAAVGCALAAAALAYRLAGGPPTPGRIPMRLVVAATVVGLGLALAAVIVYGAATEPRASYYRVAWHDEYLPHPVLGTGAGTFALYWARSGHVASRGGALDVHSLYLETLAELGPVGLVLLLAALLLPLRAGFARGRAAYVPAAAAAYVAFLIHAGLDWDWEMPVVVVSALCCAGALVSSTVTDARPLRPGARGAVVGAALVLGARAIAGARSSTEPGAVPLEKEAPPERGLVRTARLATGYEFP